MIYPRSVTFADQANTSHVKEITTSATAHTKGSWVQFFSATDIAFDVFLAQVYISDVGGSGIDTSALLDIGADPAGGTAYSVVIPDYLIGFARDSFALDGYMAEVPVHIPSGSTVAMRHQSAQSSNTAELGLTLHGGIPTENPYPQAGLVVAYGVTVSTSRGVSPANAAADTEGAWVEIVASTTHPHRGLTIGGQGNKLVSSGADFLIDIGLGASTSEVAIVEDIFCSLLSAEMFKFPANGRSFRRPIPEGSRISVRAQASKANRQADIDVAVYGWG